MKNDIRLYVFNSLLSSEANERYINLESDSFLRRSELSPRDRSFYTALLYGVTERRITLDYQIGKLTAASPAKLQAKVRILLRMGLYQLLYMDSVPAHAAVSETVSLAKRNVNPGAVGLINGVLRRASSELIDPDGSIRLFLPDKTSDISGYMSVQYGFPRWMCKLWLRAYGEERTRSIMTAMNRYPGISLRVNTLKLPRSDYLELLLRSGYHATASPTCDDGIILESGSVSALPGYIDGYFFVQDDSSRLAVTALDPQPGEKLLDCCACPGGKSFASAIAMHNTGKIISADIHDNKLPLISSGAARLGIDIISTLCADASVFTTDLESAFDRVLCDVPCSGLGTIAKKPDLRFKSKESVEALPALQYRILCNCSSYVRPGGVLLYSTCTLNPSENEDNVRLFLAEHPCFVCKEMRTIFPGDSPTDGFFYSVLIRQSE